MIKTKPKKIPGSGSVDGLRTPNYTSSETAKKMKKKTGRKTRFLWLYFVLSIKMQIKILFVFFALWRTKHDPSTFKKSASCVAYTKGNVLIDFEGKARHFDGGLVGSVRKILGRKMLHEEAKVNLKRFDTSQFLPRNIVPGAHKVMFTNHLHFHQSAVEIGWGTIQLLAICPWVIQQPSVQNILRLRVMTSAPKKKSTSSHRAAQSFDHWYLDHLGRLMDFLRWKNFQDEIVAIWPSAFEILRFFQVVAELLLGDQVNCRCVTVSWGNFETHLSLMTKYSTHLLNNLLENWAKLHVTILSWSKYANLSTKRLPSWQCPTSQHMITLTGENGQMWEIFNDNQL